MAEQGLSYSRSMTHLIMGYIPTRAIYVAAKLGLADHIDDAGITAQDLARRLQVDPGALRRIMRVLGGLSILREADADRFYLTPFGEVLRTDSRSSVRDYAIYSHEFVYPELSNIMRAVETGKPVLEDHFTHLHRNPELESVFHSAMSTRGRIDSAAVINAYDFSHCRLVADIGGGNGAFLSGLLAAHEQISGLLFDQESAIEAAKSGRGGPLPRCDFAVGNFFESIPTGADTYVLKRVLDDWSDDEVVRILVNCRKAMKVNSNLLIIDPLIGAPNEQTPGHLYDVMFLTLMTGRIRTAEDYSQLLARAQFQLSCVVPTESDVSVLEALAC